MPNINLNITGAWAILAGFLIFSYFTRVGWWAWTGLFIFFIRLLPDNDTGKQAAYVLLLISLFLFVLGVLTMDWSYT